VTDEALKQSFREIPPALDARRRASDDDVPKRARREYLFRFRLGRGRGRFITPASRQDDGRDECRQMKAQAHEVGLDSRLFSNFEL
jgi:hypothetical protein